MLKNYNIEEILTPQTEFDKKLKLNFAENIEKNDEWVITEPDIIGEKR